MTTKHMLAPKLHALLSSLSEHGEQHLSEVENDLAQTNLLLSEAIVKLNGSFMALHSAVMTQQRLVEEMVGADGASNSIVQALHEASGEIEQHVNAAVTGLQFQDMTEQLIMRTLQRVTGFKDVLQILCADGHDAAADGNEIDRLERVQTVLDEQSRALELTLRKAVRQTHLESGDIELF